MYRTLILSMIDTNKSTVHMELYANQPERLGDLGANVLGVLSTPYFRMIGTMQHQDSGGASKEHVPASKGTRYFRED